MEESRMTNTTMPESNTDPGTEMAKAYEPRRVEARWYDWWEAQGYFHARARTPTESHYTIIMPPPNVTGELHMGHALTNAVEDILIRWQAHERLSDALSARRGPCRHRGPVRGGEGARQRGPSSRHDLGREKFLERAWEWMHLYRPQHQRRSCAGSAHRATGAASASRWTPARRAPCARCSSTCTTKG